MNRPSPSQPKQPPRELKPLGAGMPSCLFVNKAPIPSRYEPPLFARNLVAEWQREEDLLAAETFPTRSLLLTGPTGVGKSLSARWIAAQLGRPAVCMSLAGTIASVCGETGQNLSAGLRFAAENPCVLLIDEIDSIAASRKGNSRFTDHAEFRRITNTLLQELDLWHGEARKSLLVATSNMTEEIIDPAVWRRFESQHALQLPSAAELSSIAGVPWPAHFIVSHAECARMSLLARRQAVMLDADYAASLSSLLSAFPREGSAS